MMEWIRKVIHRDQPDHHLVDRAATAERAQKTVPVVTTNRRLLDEFQRMEREAAKAGRKDG